MRNRQLWFSSVVALLLALVSRPIAAFFFGVQVTNPAGGVIGATDPATTGLLAGLGLAAGTLGALGLGAALNNQRPSVQVVTRRPTQNYYHHNNRYRYYRRKGKRQAESENLEGTDTREVIEATLQLISRNNLEGCFQRLFCDIAAKPSGFERDLPIVAGVRLAKKLDLNPEVTDMSTRLLDAFNAGGDLKTVESCESKFDQCAWTGQEMDAEIERMSIAYAAQQQQQQQQLN